MTTALKPVEEFALAINNMQDQFKTALPTHIKPEKFANVVITAIRKTPGLLNKNRQSLYNACMECAKDGLIPDGREAAFIPYKDMIRYTPMVTGLAKKARNSGEIHTLDALVVYENDEYDAWVDEKGPHFKHRRARGDRGKPILTYAYAVTKDGGIYHEEINEEEMDKIRKCCKANDTPWKGSFKDEMKRKSAIRRLAKYRLPSSSDIDSTIRQDDDMYDLNDQEDNEQTPDQQKPVKSSLEKAVVGDDVEDAEITKQEEGPVDPKEEEKEKNPTEDLPKSKGKQWYVEGVIEKLTEKSGNTNGKPWTKYGCMVNEKWFGTFSDTVYGQMIDYRDKKSNVKITFEETKKGDKTLRNIIKIIDQWPEEVGKNTEETSEEEIPI